jgi:hypothetical protein
MLHDREIYIEHTYRVLTMCVCTQLRYQIWHAGWSFCLVDTVLQLQAGTSTCPSSRSHSIDNLLEVVKHANLHCMEKVGRWKIAHNTGTMLKHIESSVNMVGHEFGIGCYRVGIAEHSILVVITPVVLQVRGDVISKWVH